MKEGIISLTSMLNKNGHGCLYFGVKNDGSVVGQQIGANTTSDIANKMKNYLKPFVSPKISILSSDGKDVVKVEVVGSDTPYSFDGRYYKRSDDQDLLMSQNELEFYFQSKNITYSKWEKTLTNYTIDDIDEELLIKYIDKANETNRLNYRYVDVEDALTKLGLLENGYLNNAGYYLFGNKKPLLLKLAIFATDQRITFADNRQFFGNIYECIEEAIRYIANNIHYNASIIGVQRVEKTEIPLEAIREIIVNSFAHMRITEGEYNEVIITPKRVRIYNPGTIALNKDPIEFANGSVGSKIRNPLIALTLYKNKTIEAFGTGFKRVFDFCYDAKVNYQYGSDGMGFYFEFLRNNISNDSLNDSLNILSDVLNKLDNEIIRYAKENDNMINSIPQLALYLNKSNITIQRAITRLVSLNIVERVGSKKVGYWRIK